LHALAVPQISESLPGCLLEVSGERVARICILILMVLSLRVCAKLGVWLKGFKSVSVKGQEEQEQQAT
jgi:hypothetical protein